MEAYGQFAWKLRHYRRGPPESNHSSNGPVCRHLGGRLAGTPYSSYLSPSFFILRTAVPFSLAPVLSSYPRFFDSYYLDVSFSHSPRMFRLRQSIIAGSLRRRFYRYQQGRPFKSRGRRDLSALTIAHSIVSTIGELNGETKSFTSRASFG